MGNLKSFERINRYLKESPERVFFRFTNTLREEPLSEYEDKVSRGEAKVSYVSTPFGIYSYPFKYFFLDKSVKSLSDFFYLLSKGVVKRRVEQRGEVGYFSRTSLAELGKGSALFAGNYNYIRFLVISSDAKVWTIGENDPWIDGSKALGLYKEVLDVHDLTPIYEIIPLSVRKFSPLGPFFLFPYAVGKSALSLVENGLIEESLYDSFEDIILLVFKEPNQYLKNLESALRELLFSKEAEEYEFFSFLEWLKQMKEEERERVNGQSTDKLLKGLPFALPLTSFIISFYFSRNEVMFNRKNGIGDSYLAQHEIEKMIYEFKPYRNLFLFSFGYRRLLDIAKELGSSSEDEVKRKFFEVRKEILDNVVRIVSTYSKGQVLYLRRLISSLINKLFNKYTEKKPSPSRIVSLSLENQVSKGFVYDMVETFYRYLFGFYLTINPFTHFLSELWEEDEEKILILEEKFLNRLAGRSGSPDLYIAIHKDILEKRNSNRHPIKYREIVLRAGFQVIVDPGYGLIHPNEPVQAVILDDSVLEYDDYFENFPYIYWDTLEELLSEIKRSFKDGVDIRSAVIRYTGKREMFWNKEEVLSMLINLYLDFSFLSKLLSSLGIGKEDQDEVKKALVYKMKELSEKMEPKAVKRVMSKSILNFFLDKKSFPPKKMKKAFREIKRVLSRGDS
jgi:hypothetical protein